MATSAILEFVAEGLVVSTGSRDSTADGTCLSLGIRLLQVLETYKPAFRVKQVAEQIVGRERRGRVL
jgi:hypothetical protein